MSLLPVAEAVGGGGILGPSVAICFVSPSVSYRLYCLQGPPGPPSSCEMRIWEIEKALIGASLASYRLAIGMSLLSASLKG